MLTGSQLFLVSLAALLCQSGAIPNGYSSMVINGGRNIDTEDYGGSSYVPYPLLDSETADIRPKRESPPIVKPSPQIYSLAITSNIRYRYAETLISNRVANPLNVSQEISFTVTLPESAFISKFLMIVKDKVYEAYVKEKEEARKDYQAAVDRGESAGHVELSARDSNVFTVSVNVEALNKVTFNLTYEQLLKRTLGLYENVITINPGQIVKSLLVQVNIEESSNITVLEVPDLKTNNEIDDSAATVNKLAVIERPATNKAQITWSPTSEQQAQISESGPHGQFIVRYDVDRKSHPSQILIDEGYFVHFYAPTDLKTLRKHVVFTLDVSGSMQGRKIEQLKEALLQILSDISETDFFTIILFSDSVQLWTLNGTYGETVSRWTYYEEPTTTSTTTTARPESELNKEFIIPATPENVAKAKEFAKTINDTGGTNIIAALRKSLDISKWGQKNKADGAQPIIIFLTDGQPNVELSDTEEIIKAVRKQNTDKYALFSLAFGDGADYNFLRKLSLSSNGFARNIYVASDTALQLKNFYKEVASPLLADVSFQYLPGQVQENTTTREKFSNLFAGSELVVAGKLSSDVETLSGNITGIDAELAICYFPMPPIITLPPPIETIVNKTYGHLEKLWAYLYIQELLDKDAISDEKNSTYKQKALELSLQYSFVTPLTSLVVVKPNETVSQGLGKEPIPEFESLLAPHRLSQGYAAAAPAGMYGSAAAPTFIADRYDAVFAESDVEAGFETYATTSLIHDHTVYEPSQPRYLNLTDIAWLNGTTEVKYPSSNITYSIAPSDLPNAAYQICLSPNDKSQGHCRHLAHCVLAAITVSFEDFIPFGEQCVIDARFVGICCPDVASIPDASSTPPATSTDDGSTAQTTGVTL